MVSAFRCEFVTRGFPDSWTLSPDLDFSPVIATIKHFMRFEAHFSWFCFWNKALRVDGRHNKNKFQRGTYEKEYGYKESSNKKTKDRES